MSKKSRVTLDFGNSPLSQDWKDRITKQLNEMPEVFAQHDLDFGWTQKVKHRIKLSDETPFKQRAQPIHPQDFEAVRKHLQELLSSGIIRESESPFSSPIVVVKKKNGNVRLCIDYRKLNLQTIKDAYALPNLEETFAALNGSKWFTVLDLKSGYYQIEVEESNKPKTAFMSLRILGIQQDASRSDQRAEYFPSVNGKVHGRYQLEGSTRVFRRLDCIFQNPGGTR